MSNRAEPRLHGRERLGDGPAREPGEAVADVDRASVPSGEVASLAAEEPGDHDLGTGDTLEAVPRVTLAGDPERVVQELMDLCRIVAPVDTGELHRLLGEPQHHPEILEPHLLVTGVGLLRGEAHLDLREERGLPHRIEELLPRLQTLDDPGLVVGRLAAGVLPADALGHLRGRAFGGGTAGGAVDSPLLDAGVQRHGHEHTSQEASDAHHDPGRPEGVPGVEDPADRVGEARPGQGQQAAEEEG